MLCFCFWIIVQILLESFPVSSSGHCLLLELFIQKYHYHINHFDNDILLDGVAPAFPISLLDHYVHGVTVVLVALFFFRQWFFWLRHFNRCYRPIIKMIGLACIADLIAVGFYVIFHAYPSVLPLPIGFVVTALLLLSVYYVPSYDTKRRCLDWRTAIILGVVQGCALLPGVSRLASTYACARWMSFSPHKSFAISWMLVWPLLTGAFLHSIFVLLALAPDSILLSPTVLLVMMSAAFISWLALCWVASLAYRQKLWIFGIYMIIPIIIACIV